MGDDQRSIPGAAVRGNKWEASGNNTKSRGCIQELGGRGVSPVPRGKVTVVRQGKGARCRGIERGAHYPQDNQVNCQHHVNLSADARVRRKGFQGPRRERVQAGGWWPRLASKAARRTTQCRSQGKPAPDLPPTLASAFGFTLIRMSRMMAMILDSTPTATAHAHRELAHPVCDELHLGVPRVGRGKGHRRP